MKTGLFFASCAALLFETLLPPYLLFIRYHAHYLSVLGSVFLGICLGSMVEKKISLHQCCLGLLWSIVVFFSVTLAIPPSLGYYWELLIFNAALCVPFFFFGCLISQCFADSLETGKIYAVHMLGCSLGVLAGVVLLRPLGLERCVVFAMLLCLQAAVHFSKQAKRGTRYVWLFILLGVLTVFPPDIVRVSAWLGLPHPEYKKIFVDPGSIRYTRWDHIARIDVAPVAGQQWLFFNGSMFTPVANPDVFSAERALPFQLFDKPKSLIIGAGGGLDLATARRFSDSVTGVEISEPTVRLMRRELAEESGEIYRKARIVRMEGRGFIRVASEKFDVILLPFADAHSATLYGNYHLESYLYTEEAFREYLEHLSGSGVLMVVKFIENLVSWQTNEILKILSTWRLASNFDPEFRKKIILYSELTALPGSEEGTGVGYLMYKKDGFSQAQVEWARREIKKNNLTLVYAPGHPGENIYSRLVLSRDAQEYRELLKQYPEDISSVTDDRPYLYLTNKGYVGLKRICAILCGLAALGMCVMARALFRASRPRAPAAEALLFFAFLGSASVIAQLTSMQWFSLILGSPMLSFSLVLCAYLGMGALASYLCEKIKLYGPIRTKIAAMVIMLLLLILHMMMRLQAPRMSVAALLLFFLASGVLFPSMFMHFQRLDRGYVFLCWGSSAVGTLLGYAVFLWISSVWGVLAAFKIAMLLYLIACSLWTWMMRRVDLP